MGKKYKTHRPTPILKKFFSGNFRLKILGGLFLKKNFWEIFAYIYRYMKKLIQELFRRMIFESESWGFFKDRTRIPDYDAILFGKQDELPKKYADWVGEIEWMTKEEYFKECARIQNTSYSDQFKYVIPEKVKSIQNNMSNGVKYDMPYLNYVSMDQEGRHRVMAASELGQVKIPVLILDKKEEVSRSSLSEMVGIWKDMVKDGDMYYFKTTGTGWAPQDRVLKCIVRGYDTYLLDELISMVSYPSLYPNELSLIKKDNIKYITQYVNGSYIRYDGDIEVNEMLLKLCVVLRCLMNNSYVVSNIKKNGDDWYLPIPNNIKGDFDRYESCFEMLNTMGHEYYIQEYGLLSLDTNNSLYRIQDSDIKKIQGLF